MQTLGSETALRRTVERTKRNGLYVHLSLFLYVQFSERKVGKSLDGHRFAVREGSFASSKTDYISLNDLNHITMADSKVESVQTFGRKVQLGPIVFIPVSLLLDSFSNFTNVDSITLENRDRCGLREEGHWPYQGQRCPYQSPPA